MSTFTISKDCLDQVIYAFELALVRMEDLALATPELEAETDRHAETIKAALIRLQKESETT